MLVELKTADRRLPVGMPEFDRLIKDLKAAYEGEMPTIDDDTIRFVVATAIMHMGPLDSHKSLEFFYNTLVAGAAKQISHQIFRDIKLKQDAELKKAKEEALAKAAEEVSENGTK